MSFFVNQIKELATKINLTKKMYQLLRKYSFISSKTGTNSTIPSAIAIVTEIFKYNLFIKEVRTEWNIRFHVDAERIRFSMCIILIVLYMGKMYGSDLNWILFSSKTSLSHSLSLLPCFLLKIILRIFWEEIAMSVRDYILSTLHIKIEISFKTKL